MTEPNVVRDDAESRYQIDVDGTLAVLAFQWEGDVLDLRHTEVPDALEGQGLGGHLVKAALADAARDDLTVVPSCTFVRGWLERHPEVAATVKIEAPAT